MALISINVTELNLNDPQDLQEVDDLGIFDYNPTQRQTGDDRKRHDRDMGVRIYLPKI